MIKVLLERTIKGKNVGEIVRLLRMLRVKAMQQPGYISGETLHAVDDPNQYLVISAWETLKDWDSWRTNPERRELQAELDNILEMPGKNQGLYLLKLDAGKSSVVMGGSGPPIFVSTYGIWER